MCTNYDLSENDPLGQVLQASTDDLNLVLGKHNVSLAENQLVLLNSIQSRDFILGNIDHLSQMSAESDGDMRLPPQVDGSNEPTFLPPVTCSEWLPFPLHVTTQYFNPPHDA
jgi:hypothetical protein